MPVLTEQQRTQQIQQRLKALDKQPPDRPFAVELIQIGGDECRCPVISFPAEDVLLNPHSHRLQSQLQGDAEWCELADDPYSARAQQVLERQVREARSGDAFQALKESLLRDGQEQAGVMTHRGVLINANTRAVAIRTFDDPTRRNIKAAVLPETVRDSELALLELRQQMQRDLKAPYSLTNELLFIEEMYTKHKTPIPEIARHLRYGTGRKGEQEVSLRLKLLTFIRQLQKIPEGGLKLTFFDEVKVQHLKDLQAKHEAMAAKDETAAGQLLQNWLLSVKVGLIAVHKLRFVDERFDVEYMFPRLEEDEGLGMFATTLVTTASGNGEAATPAGVSALLGSKPTTPAATSVASNLLNLLNNDDKRIEVKKPGANNPVQLDRRDVHEAIKAATFTGVRDKEGDDRNDNKLDAPAAAIKAATKGLEKAVIAVSKVHDDPEFDKGRRSKLAMHLKKHRKAVKNTEASFADFDVTVD